MGSLIAGKGVSATHRLLPGMSYVVLVDGNERDAVVRLPGSEWVGCSLLFPQQQQPPEHPAPITHLGQDAAAAATSSIAGQLPALEIPPVARLFLGPNPVASMPRKVTPQRCKFGLWNGLPVGCLSKTLLVKKPLLQHANVCQHNSACTGHGPLENTDERLALLRLPWDLVSTDAGMSSTVTSRDTTQITDNTTVCPIACWDWQQRTKVLHYWPLREIQWIPLTKGQ